MNRRKQNEVVKDWDAFKSAVMELDERIVPILMRGTYDTGRFTFQKSKRVDPEDGTPPPAYADLTGETAIRIELPSSVNSDLEAIAKHIEYALNTAKAILAITPVDAAERAERTIPDCTACGDPIIGKIFYGRWDDKCRQRFRKWVDEGNPADEKLRFEQIIQESNHLA